MTRYPAGEGMKKDVVTWIELHIVRVKVPLTRTQHLLDDGVNPSLNQHLPSTVLVQHTGR